MTFAKKTFCMLGLLIAGFSATGCQIVNVENDMKKPVAWANVQVYENGQPKGLPVMTDMMGNAILPMQMDPKAKQKVVVTHKDYLTASKTRSKDMSMRVIIRPNRNKGNMGGESRKMPKPVMKNR